jgi:hypothetical protein
VGSLNNYKISLEDLKMGSGIDYGGGLTNVDHKTGIRYGVLNQNEILQRWCDESELHYPCKDCDVQSRFLDENSEDDYNSACEMCEPTSFYISNDRISAESDTYGDIFIVKSLWYTRAAFCSPCAPGACYLTDPDDDGERAYCFPPDYFDESISPCPYPVYLVSTDEQIYTPRESDEI